MAPQLRIRQQTKARAQVDPPGDDKMAETSDPDKSSVNSEDNEENEDEVQELVCKSCLKCFSSPRRLDNHKAKCRKSLKLESSTENSVINIDVDYTNVEQDPLQIKCRFCSKVFVRQRHLRNHQVKCLSNKKVVQNKKSKMKLKCLSKVQKVRIKGKEIVYES